MYKRYKSIQLLDDPEGVVKVFPFRLSVLIELKILF